MSENNEKRKYPRLKDEGVSLKVKSGTVDIITKSLDISASGIYCKVENELPIMSRIHVTLIVPKFQKNYSGKFRTSKIETDGVVVREHPVIDSGKIVHHDVAIFFDNISAKDRDALLEYINHKTQAK